MGDGELIESGTHDELLANSDGAYARLVNAQKLREQEPADDNVTDPDALLETTTPAATLETIEEDEKAISLLDSEDGLKRVNTGNRSIASEALSRRNRFRKEKEQTEYGMVYLFKRMGAINSDDKGIYIWGTLGAIGESCLHYIPSFDTLIGSHSETSQLLAVSILFSESVRISYSHAQNSYSSTSAS